MTEQRIDFADLVVLERVVGESASAVRVLSIDGTTARVSCRVTQTLTPRVGYPAVTRVMRLRRGRLECRAPVDLWVIDGFKR